MLGQGVCIFFLKHILEFFILGRNLMWTWLNIYWRNNINKKCISFLGSLHKSFCFKKQMLRAPRPFCTTEVSFCFKFCMHSSPCLFSVTWHTPSWFLLCLFLTRVSHSMASCFGVLNWRLLICQSTHGLCKTSQNKSNDEKNFLEMKWHWR